MSRHRGGFPDGTFGGLAITKQHVDTLVGTIEAGTEGHAETGRKALPQRTRGYVHKGQCGGRVPFQVAVDFAKAEQILDRNVAGLRPGRVQGRRGVALRENEDIVRRVGGIGRVITHHREKQGGHNFGDRGATGRVSAARLRRRSDGVNP